VVVKMAGCTRNICAAGRTTTTHFLWFLAVIYITFVRNLTFTKIQIKIA
jgi:hypothetical protein